MPAPVPCASIKKAGVFVAIVEALLCVLAVYGLFRNWGLFGSSYFFWFILGILSVIVIALAIVLLLIAIYREKPRLLIPHLSAQVFLILFLIIVAFVVALLLVFQAYQGIRNLLGHGTYYFSDDAVIFVGILIIVIYILIAILECFFLVIVWKLYKHLRRMNEARKEAAFEWTSAKPVQLGHGSPLLGHVYPYAPCK